MSGGRREEKQLSSQMLPWLSALFLNYSYSLKANDVPLIKSDPCLHKLILTQPLINWKEKVPKKPQLCTSLVYDTDTL